MEGNDYNEKISPIVKNSSIRVMLVMIVMLELELQQLGIKQHTFMGNWRRKYLWNNQKDSRSKENSILYTSSKDLFTD